MKMVELVVYFEGKLSDFFFFVGLLDVVFVLGGVWMVVLGGCDGGVMV